jgi:hypothetical protein
MTSWSDYQRVKDIYVTHVEGEAAPAGKSNPGWELFADPVGRFAVSVGAAVKEVAAKYGDVDLSDVEIVLKVKDRDMRVKYSQRTDP